MLRCSMMRVLTMCVRIVSVLMVGIEIVSVLMISARWVGGSAPSKAARALTETDPPDKIFFLRVHYTGAMFRAMCALRIHCRHRVSGLQ